VIEMIDLLCTKVFLSDKEKFTSLSGREKWIEHHNELLDKGYDFRDFCNEIKDPQMIEEIIKNTIKAKL
jgi:hypothetical protein